MALSLPPLGVQSYCYREFKSVERLIEGVVGAGITHVEVWGGHFTHQDRAVAEANVGKLRAAGLTMSAFGLPKLGKDEAADRAGLDFCRWAGLTSIGSDADAEDTDRVDGLLREYGLKLVVHNHGRNDARYGKVSQLKAYLDRTPPTFGVLMDTAWLLDAGEDPVAALDVLGERTYGVHVKDFRFVDGKPVDVVVGQGDLDVRAFLPKLAGFGKVEFMSLEYEADAENPVPALRACAEVVRGIVG